MRKRTSKLLMLLLGLVMTTGCFQTSSQAPGSSEKPPGTSVTTEQPPSSETPPSSEQPPSSSEVVEPGEPIARGTVADALANPGTLYLSVGDKVNVTYARIVDDVARVQFTVEEGVAYDALKLLFKSPAPAGRYKVSVVVEAAASFSGLINGERYDFIRGETDLEMYYDEVEGALSLEFVFAIDEEGLGLKANNVSFKDMNIEERLYGDPETALAVDGSLDDWLDLRAYENTVGVHSNTPEVKHKSVDFYASLTSTGLYLAADAYHDLYIDDADTWWKCTNFEIFIKGGNQYWVSARKVDEQITKHSKVDQAAMVTIPLEGGEGVANYHTIAEMFIANANLPTGAILGGEIRVGFAWKTDGDLLDNGEANGGGMDCYWVPKGTWTNNADQTFVNINGIFRSTQLVFEPTTMTIDGDLSDWEDKAAYTTNKIYIEGSDATSHKNVTFMAFLNEEGLFVAALAHHDVLINDNETWHHNTNFEFFLNGGNQFYVTAAGHVSYGTGVIVSDLYGQGDAAAEYESIAEMFVPAFAFAEGDMQRIGFAWKTNGDTCTGLGGSGGAPDAWWFEPGHFPNNINEQYYVTAEGVFRSAP